MLDFTGQRIYLNTHSQEEWEALLTIMQDNGWRWRSGHLPLDYKDFYDPKYVCYLSCDTYGKVFGYTPSDDC